MFRIHTAGRIQNQRPGHIAARAKTALHRFHKVDIFLHRRLPVLHGHPAHHFIVFPLRRIPPAPDRHTVHGFGPPVVGVQKVSGIDLKRKHRPQKERPVFPCMGHGVVNRIGHLRDRRTFRGVFQHIAARRLNIVGFGLDDARWRKSRGSGCNGSTRNSSRPRLSSCSAPVS